MEKEDDFLLQAVGYDKCILHFRNGGKHPGFSLCPGLVRISLSLPVCLSASLALALPSSSSSLLCMVSYGNDDDVTAVLARSSRHTLIVREVDNGSSSQAVFLLSSSSSLLILSTNFLISRNFEHGARDRRIVVCGWK